MDKELAARVLDELPFIKEDLDYFYNYHSSKIENNSLTYGETVTLLKDGFGVAKPIKDIHDMENHHKALGYLHELVKADEPLSIRGIREIQALIEPEKSGFRKNLVEILNTLTKTAEPFEIAIRLQELVDDYNNSTDDLFTRLAKFHVAFETIHPFVDGNGRTGRMLLNLELMKNGYPLTAIKFEDRAKYYDAFGEGVESMRDLIKKSVEDTYSLIEKKAKGEFS